jgi:hypothetical protein
VLRIQFDKPFSAFYLSFDHILTRMMVKDGQRWSKMVNFKFLTTFGEIPENPVLGK